MTAGQRAVLAMLTSGPSSASDIAYRQLGYPHTYASVHASLRRLEDKQLVRRTGAKHITGQVWELTKAGRHALEQTG